MFWNPKKASKNDESYFNIFLTWCRSSTVKIILKKQGSKNGMHQARKELKNLDSVISPTMW